MLPSMRGKTNTAEKRIAAALASIYSPEYIAACTLYYGHDHDRDGLAATGWWLRPPGEDLVFWGETEADVLEAVEFIRGLP